MKPFVSRWADAATTGVGLFYTAFWAFALGYFVSSLIQVFVTRERMRRLMGTTGPRSVGLGTLFGFVSSSCSFAALSTTRALFARGAGLVPSMAFLLASTNLVVELGIVIALFLAWPFVLAEYVGGLLLIAFAGAIIALTRPSTLIDEARRHAQDAEGGHDHGGGDHDRGRSIWRGLRSPTAWRQVAETYVAEWRMVYQDVTLGFTVAGIIAVFVPASFFAALFPGAPASHPSLGEVVGQALIGPVAAFFTFIGSMGNIPLAAVLFGHGVSFAGVMAFIFSDLVVLPVLRIQARYYGWKMALYLLGVMLASLVSVAVLMHYGFDALGWLPTSGGRAHMAQRSFFSLDGTLLVNLACLVASLGAYLWTRERDEAEDGGASSPTPSLGARVMRAATALCGLWLLAGLGLALVTDASRSGTANAAPARRMHQSMDMQTIDRQSLRQLMARQPRLNLIEVLSSDDYDEGHLPGAINIPLADDFEKTVKQTIPNQDKVVVVYCQHEDCDASPKAAERLEAMGYSHVYDYEGGKRDWADAGLSLHGAS